MVVFTREDLVKGLDGLLQGYQSTFNTGEDLSDGEGLRHESLRDQLKSRLKAETQIAHLDLSGSLDSELVLLGQLIHTHYEA